LFIELESKNIVGLIRRTCRRSIVDGGAIGGWLGWVSNMLEAQAMKTLISWIMRMWLL
jgi:hypothetical protein